MYGFHRTRPKSRNQHAAFTFIELVIVMGIIATLFSLIIIAIHPTKNLQDARDTSRRSAMIELQNAVYQYLIDNGSLPDSANIGEGSDNAKQICSQTATVTTSCINLQPMVVKNYIARIPQDVSELNSNWSGYTIYMNRGRAVIESTYFSATKIAAGLVHQWKFDESSGAVAADAIGTFDESLVGSPTWTAGKFGNAINLNGSSQYGQTAGALPTTMSVSVWAASTVIASPMLFNAGASGVGPDLFFYGGQLYWNTWDGAGNPFGAIPATANDGQFHNYVVINNQTANTTKLYYDGALIGTAGYRAPGAIFYIGGVPPYLWNGKIDDVRIYNRALGTAEIQQIAAGNG